MTRTQIALKKRGFIARIKRIVAPYFWKTGYVGVEGFFFEEHAGRPTRSMGRAVHSEGLKTVRGFVKCEREGFGIAEDAYAGGLVTVMFACYCLEDLITIEKWLLANFAKEVGRHKEGKKKREAQKKR